ncbi:MAG: LysE family transporter [Candidatus Kapabacteria bacterium]|jgi:threonine/homoserine/homoserine lactone efflux protein|nr:LysE family transporter [Candidatus Kapabacteria bacterium]
MELLLTLLTGLVLGLLVAIPPGPVMVVIVRAALTQGKAYTLRIAYGIALLDVMYSFAFSLATGTIVSTFDGIMTRFPHLLTILQACAVIGLIVYGAISLRSNLSKAAETLPAAEEKDSSAVPNLGIMNRVALYGPFFIGIALSLTHLANPTFIPLMTTVSYVASKYGFMHSGVVMQHCIFALGYAAGVLSWLVFLTYMALRYRHVFSGAVMLKINRLLGFTMIGFGTYWGYERFAHAILLLLRDALKFGIAF